ncbi:MAG: YncE family protein, partial [Methylocella sp.]
SITAHDLFGNTATGYTGLHSLTFSGLANAPDGSIPEVETIDFGLGTSVNFTAGVSDAGVATLIAYEAEGPVPVDVTDGSIDTSYDAAHDLDLTVDFGPAHNLVFLQQPTTADANVVIAPAITVGVRDQFNNLIITDNVTSVAMGIGTNPGGGTLAGTTPQIAASGIATFADLSIDSGGTGYTLDATSAGLVTATSDPFDIIAPPSPPGGLEPDTDPAIDALIQTRGAPLSFEALGEEEAGAPSRFFYGGRALYVTTVDGVEIYELSTHKLLATFPWRETPSNIFSSGRDGIIYVLMPRSNRIIILNSDFPGRRSIHGLKGQPADMAMTADGSVAYITNALEDTVQVLDVKRKKVRSSHSAGSMPGSAVLSPDSRRLFVANTLDHT